MLCVRSNAEIVDSGIHADHVPTPNDHVVTIARWHLNGEVLVILFILRTLESASLDRDRWMVAGFESQIAVTLADPPIQIVGRSDVRHNDPIRECFSDNVVGDPRHVVEGTDFLGVSFLQESGTKVTADNKACGHLAADDLSELLS